MNLPLPDSDFCIIKPRHLGGLKKQIWAEKPAVGTLVTCGKRLLPGTDLPLG